MSDTAVEAVTEPRLNVTAGTPLYDGLVLELGDPAEVCRDFDTYVINWHVTRLPKPLEEESGGRS